jgi:NTP pyrophosphatase (non-canonical NTP hydrolase)
LCSLNTDLKERRMDIEKEAQQWLKEKYKDMEMNEYQRKSVKFAIYPATHRILYPALGLAGEAGEVANKVKKFIRDGADKESFEVKKVEIAAEIGDVLWYCAALAHDLGFNLSDIASENYSKLSGRSERGTLGGDGDNR